MEKIQLKPCPNCGATKRVFTVKALHRVVKKYMLMCDNCGCSGMSVPFEWLARLLWNRKSRK